MDITEIWGVNEKIGPAEIAARSVVMFVCLLIVLRMGGMRSFGKGDAFDNVVTILLGAVVARGIAGATPFISALVSGIMIVLVHNILCKLSFYSHWFGRKAKGRNYLLYQNNVFVEENLKQANITQKDIAEELRLTCQSDSLQKIKEVYLERNGEISFVKNE